MGFYIKLFLLGELSVLVLASVFACGFIFARSIHEEPGDTAPSVGLHIPGAAVLDGKIESIKSGGGLEIRLVEWVEGENNKEQAALESGSCTLNDIENDSCLPNDFFIRQTGKTITLSPSPKVRVFIYARVPEEGMKADGNGNIYKEEIGFPEFVQKINQMPSLKLVPYAFTTTNGLISVIEEQYVP